jgi:protoporphyrinogen/coproporphyrinogen III oxidase
MTVLVVGGGITGLAAARALGLAGVPTLLVEASERLGGKVRTERADGFVIEHGPDSVLTTRPAAVALAREVGLGEELIGLSEPRTVYILRDGRMIPMPAGLGLVLPTRVRPFVSSKLFSWPDKARMALDLVMPRVASPADESVGAFLRRRLGGALVDRLAGPLVGGIYGTSLDELSLDAVVPQLREAERTHRSLLLAGLADGRRMRAAAAQRAGAETKTGGAVSARPLGIFASLAGGLGDLVDAVARSAEATGAVTIRRGVSVTALETSGAGVHARLSDGTSVRADAVIVTTPGPAVAALVGPFAPKVAAAIDTIPHGSSTVVTLAYREDRLPGPLVGHGVLVPVSERLPISAVTWSSNKWPGRAPDGVVLLRAFLPDEPATGRSEADLVALARQAVEATMWVHGTPEIVRVSPWRGTMPRYTVGHLERVARAERELAAWPTIRLAGAPYHGVGLPDCIGQAHAAVAAVVERLERRVVLRA